MSWMLGTVLENEVQDVAEAQPDRAIILMAQLIPRQTPTCRQEFGTVMAQCPLLLHDG